MLLPMPSTGASRLLMLFKVGVLEKRERTLDDRFANLDVDSRRRKSERKAFASWGWYIGSETVAATLLEKSGVVGYGSFSFL